MIMMVALFHFYGDPFLILMMTKTMEGTDDGLSKMV